MGCFESCFISSSSVVFPCLMLPNLCCFFQGVSCLIYIPLASLAGHTLIPSFFSQCYQKYRSSVELGTVQVKNKIPGFWPKSHFFEATYKLTIRDSSSHGSTIQHPGGCRAAGWPGSIELCVLRESSAS